MSDETQLEIGLPQGAGAGPFGYKAYAKPLGSLIRSLLLEVLYHMFADDNQLYKSLSPNSIESQLNTRSDMETCLNSLCTWLFENKLKLNESNYIRCSLVPERFL